MTLQPVTHIDPPAWMRSDEALSTMRALGAYEGMEDPPARFVGGCVRNALIGKAAGDVDIATQHAPETVMEMLGAAGIKVLPTGLQHGTVTAVINKKHYEITTLRVDVKTYGRHADVAYTNDWQEDARRRDFTMNTLLAAPDGGVFDPLGRGVADLGNRRVIFVGDPAQRIAEDYLRLLRFFRFHCIYGQGEPDDQAVKACRAAAAGLESLSRERISGEFFKILQANEPAETLNRMFANHILADLPHPNFDAPTLANLVRLQLGLGGVDFMARLVLLAGIDKDGLDRMEKWLVFSNAQKKTAKTIVEISAAMDVPTAKEIRQNIYKYGNYATLQAFLIVRAETSGDISEEVRNLADMAAHWQPPEFPLSGEDVKNAGVPAGPKLGKTLGEVESWWMKQDFEPGRQACLERLDQILGI